MFGLEAIKYLLEKCRFKTILDIGCGAGDQSAIFRDNNKIVTELDFGDSVYTRNRKSKYIRGDYLNIKFDEQFDAIWVCHVLEHQLNVNIFLTKILHDLKEEGILAITVPPKKDRIVGGHVTLWNAGLILYNLVLAGFDCSEAKIKTYDYNISVILKKQTIVRTPKITYDCGDIEKLKIYLPQSLTFKDSHGKLVMEGFNGDIKELNWN
jgi:SAM-dependent methyltransferase